MSHSLGYRRLQVLILSLVDVGIALTIVMLVNNRLVQVIGVVGMLIFMALGFYALRQLSHFTPPPYTPLPAQYIPLSDDQREENRVDMLNLVEKIWVKGLLDTTLDQLRAINLNVIVTTAEKILTPDQRPLADFYAVKQAYDDVHHRMVVLGEPGAGKTFLLVQLANHLVADADGDPTKPIPIILALSGWGEKRLPFEEWLRQEVHDQYGLAQSVVDDLVGSCQFAYLLDGLDEVAEPYREGCWQGIKQFVDYRQADFAISCRRAEYEQLATQLDGLGTLTIQPLSPKEVDRYLDTPEFETLRTLKHENPVIQEFTTNPFMLTVLADVTRDVAESTIRADMQSYSSPENETTLRAYFLDRSRDHRLHQHGAENDAGLVKTQVYLQWLATKLGEHHRTNFYLDGLQPSWLGSEQLRRRAQKTLIIGLGTLSSLTGALLVGLLFAWLDSLGNETFGKLMPWGVLIGGFCGGLLGLSSGLVAAHRAIKPSDSQRLSSDRAILFGCPSAIGSCAFVGLHQGIVLIGIIGIIYAGPLGFPAAIAYFIPPSSIVFWLVATVFGAIALDIIMALQRQVYVPSRTPVNAGIRHSLNRWLLMMLLAGTLPALTLGIVGKWQGCLIGMIGGVLYGLTFGLRHGGEAIIKHLVLRYYLWREGDIPLWRYDKFLDYAANDLIILRKVGGGYRFVHEYLRQYLASAAFVPDPMQKTE